MAKFCQEEKLILTTSTTSSSVIKFVSEVEVIKASCPGRLGYTYPPWAGIWRMNLVNLVHQVLNQVFQERIMCYKYNNIGLAAN